ncbi:hypothetical protein ACFOQM_07805 [Paenibacillus sp. GCM10012307]|uniref:Uncharacterized protein n=1 Tax=Paenibacillus roseus TaxID=2798579 RepID=A0A934MQA6_9BACL|nr:hypothetical protein [Paenibacillus roseus]MBJ6361194.1 hypothetical protein [Paenibacillus roseus]
MDNSEAKAEARRAYKAAWGREWRKRNPDKAKQAQERYWLRRLQRQLLATVGPRSGINQA